MKIVVRKKADEDLDEIFAWIAKDNPRAAAGMISAFASTLGGLRRPAFEQMGRPGLDPGTRELVEPPYIIVYEIYEGRREIEVLYIVHGAQDS